MESYSKEEFYETFNVFKLPDIGIHEELEFLSTEDKSVLGVVLFDKVDNDFSFVALGSDGKMFRAVDMGVSYKTRDEAREKLMIAMEKQ